MNNEAATVPLAPAPFYEMKRVESDGSIEFVGTERTEAAGITWIEGQVEDLVADAEEAGRMVTTAYFMTLPDLTGCAKGLAGQYCGSTEHAMH